MRSRKLIRREVIGLSLLFLAMVQVFVFLWVDSSFHSTYGPLIDSAFLKHIARQHDFETHFGWAGIVGCLLASGRVLWQARRGEDGPGSSADAPTTSPDPAV